MCCAGCAAVAAAIDEAGLSGYYRHRTAAPRSQRELVPPELGDLAVYDHEKVQASFVERVSDDRRRASLVLEGIQCAACIWLNERHLKSLPGIVDVSINYATQQAGVTWDNQVIHLSDILAAIRAIGYDAHPFDPDRQQRVLETQRRTLLKKLGVAAAVGMQVMILTVALYAGDWYGMEPEFEAFFRRFSLLLTLPVLVYSGSTFFRGALTDLKLGRVGMDVPVSLGIGLAFTASAWHVVTGVGEVYFESVCMFVLFLLGARYFELMSRSRAMIAAESIGHMRPANARRVRDEGGATETVAAVDLAPGDLVRVLPGEILPADGTVVEGSAGIDESLLTGESTPVRRGAGDSVIGGSIDTDSPLTVRVTRTGDDTVMAQIHRLLDAALAGKPEIASLADRVAGWFVAGVLAITTAVAAFWLAQGSDDWLRITVAVLVVSCPCALSLAVPTAISSSIVALMRSKILVTSPHALQTLRAATLFVFDKTGTLTLGMPRVNAVETFGGRSRDECLAVASALEAASEHPLARAIRDAANDAGVAAPPAADAANRPGAGMTGRVDGVRYRLGNRAFIADGLGEESLPPALDGGETEVLLANETTLLCRLRLADALRPEAAAAIAGLKSRGLRTALLTGDHARVAANVAATLGIDEVEAHCTPSGKLARVRAWQTAGEVVAMIGDGVNDAPVLAGADVSISAGGATPVAVSSADIVSLTPDVSAVVSVVDIARKTMTVLRQNLAWAIGYNLAAIPAAAIGLVPPWLAALGMSASSLIVIANASRLRYRAGAPDRAAPAGPEPLAQSLQRVG